MSVNKLQPDPENFAPLTSGTASSQPKPVRTWHVNPPALTRWISPDDRDNAIVLMDLEPDVLATGELRLDLRVAFKYIAVRRKKLLSQADFYIGCTSASVQIDIEGEKINAFTPGKALTVNYKEVERRTRTSKAALEPSGEFKSGAGETKLSIGGISLESGGEAVFESSFAYSERYLEAVNLGSGVIWRLDPPRRKPVVRDFLFCNLHVFVVCTDSSGRSRGRIHVRPSDLRVYGPDRRPYEKAKSLMLLCLLLKTKKLLYRPEGIEVKFSEATS